MKAKRGLFLSAVFNAMARCGLIQGAIALEVDKVDALPESQRGWYVLDDASKKYKLDPSKVEFEDTSKLKSSLEAARAEARTAKAKQDQAVADALKLYEGIDPVKTRELLNKFQDTEEAALIAAGKMDEVIARRTEKNRAESDKQIKAAQDEAAQHRERAAKFESRVLDDRVREAAVKAGLHAGAIDDALLNARIIFTLNEAGEAVQIDPADKSVKLGKDAKTPFSPGEWLEEMREKKPHWFPSNASGGGSGGSGKPGGANTITRAAFDALSHGERSKFIAGKGTVVD